MACLKALICLAFVAVATSQRVISPPAGGPVPCGSGWILTEKAATDKHTVTVVLTPRNLDLLEELALAVSNPKSGMYGQYLSKDEVNAMTAPATEHVEAVTAWLDAHDVEYVLKADVGHVEVTGTIAVLETMLSTKFHHATHYRHRQTATLAEAVTLPASITEAVSTVFGLHGLPLPPKNTPVRAGTPPDVTPDTITKDYKITGVKASGDLKNRQAVAEFQGQLMNDTDLEEFFKKYLPDTPADDRKVYKFHGTPQQGLGIEAQLDIQYIMGVAPGIKTEFYEQMNSAFCADLKNWTTLLLSNDDIPLVHSISYGWQGNLTQIGCAEADVKAVDVDFQKLANRGISIIFASGDSGSGYAPPHPPMPARCDESDPGSKNVAFQGTPLQKYKLANTHGDYICCSIAHEEGVREKYAGWTFVPGTTAEGECTIFKTIVKNMSKTGAVSGLPVPAPPPAPAQKTRLWPSWPASSPWVTSVGATRFHNDVPDGEEAAVSSEDHFGSGGGFSFQFKQQTWQADAIEHYFKTVAPSTLPDPSKVEYPKEGRATPEVSALGTGYQVIDRGAPIAVGGTSASAPAFAGMVSLLNEARIKAGKPALGFLNQWIYQNADAFTDVTIGSDKVGRGGFPLPEGFNCSKGWDPVTGVGTPDFTKLLATALQTP